MIKGPLSFLLVASEALVTLYLSGGLPRQYKARCLKSNKLVPGRHMLGQLHRLIADEVSAWHCTIRFCCTSSALK